MEFINFRGHSLCVCGLYYKKLVEHLEIMNSWRSDPELISKHPFLLDREFTLEDALQDLLMKGGL